MAKVQISDVDENLAPVNLGLSSVKFGNHSWGTHESIVKQWISDVGTHC
jgi:hypothetical protein